MRSPVVMPGPVLPPGKCMICGGGEGEMVDTTVNVRGIGRYYICLRLCMPLIGKATGYLPPADALALTDQIDEMQESRERLLDELEAERARPTQQLVSLDDLKAWSAEKKTQPAKQPAGDVA